MTYNLSCLQSLKQVPTALTTLKTQAVVLCWARFSFLISPSFIPSHEKFLFSPMIHKTSPGRGKAVNFTFTLLKYNSRSISNVWFLSSIFDKTTVSVI